MLRLVIRDFKGAVESERGSYPQTGLVGLSMVSREVGWMKM